MHTYSHLIQTAWLRHALLRRGWVVPRAFLVGSFMPDVPLLLLTLARLVAVWRSDAPDKRLFGHEYDALYFGDPLWIIGHSAMHAPILIAAGILAGFALGRWGPSERWRSFRWFWTSCGIHSFLDILTHTYDGPLVLFPFDWCLRFESPISYWDPRHYGGIVMAVEHGLDLLAACALLWFGWSRFRLRLQSRRHSGQTDQEGWPPAG